MKTLNTFTKTLFTVSLLTAVNVPTVNATEVAKQLQVDAQHSLVVTLEENLNQVVTTINGDLQKDILLTIKNDKNLVLEMVASQLIKDDKIISSVGE